MLSETHPVVDNPFLFRAGYNDKNEECNGKCVRVIRWAAYMEQVREANNPTTCEDVLSYRVCKHKFP